MYNTGIHMNEINSNHVFFFLISMSATIYKFYMNIFTSGQPGTIKLAKLAFLFEIK